MVDEKENGNKGWFISATPWVGCPVIFNLVVTSERSDVAIQMFKKYFNKEDIEISAIFPVEIVPGEEVEVDSVKDVSKLN